MGCCYSRIEREETVSRCKARKRYMKQFVQARQSFSASHSMYLNSLKTTGSALLQFATAEIHHHQDYNHYEPPLFPSPPPLPITPLPPPPPPPMSPTSSTWTHHLDHRFHTFLRRLRHRRRGGISGTRSCRLRRGRPWRRSGKGRP